VVGGVLGSEFVLESRFTILVCGGTHLRAELRDLERVGCPSALRVNGEIGEDRGDEGVEGGEGIDANEEVSDDGGEGTTGTFSKGGLFRDEGFGEGNGGKYRSIFDVGLEFEFSNGRKKRGCDCDISFIAVQSNVCGVPLWRWLKMLNPRYVCFKGLVETPAVMEKVEVGIFTIEGSAQIKGVF